ncbi:DUF4153 domain-containing protein [Roseovarius dicentrarchi]|uniref:DUF4153 domain-containing protein n=1 Tax=Roseovarius dicentrarchi TaxID=2250573 RepID=UPI000DE8AD54|nr:DUF4153 domain-containing protein [Roseovarius dicentrarchi]
MLPRSETIEMRLTFASVGAVAGLAVWGLMDVLPDLVSTARAALLPVAAGLGFFSVLLALLGPVRLAPALWAALGMAVPAALLLFWASFRHTEVERFLDTGYGVAAFVYLLAIGAPFVIAGLHRHGGWRHYGDLFDAAWSLVVRSTAAWLFVAVVWLVLLLSDQLLGLVGIGIIDDLMDVEPVPYLITGIALGLGLAIVHELRDYLSPFLMIQLLRLLLPALLLVLAVFIVALPFRGLDSLFGQFSAAATLIAVTVAGITLVTTAVHRDDSVSVQGSLMLIATRLLSAMLPVPPALAVWAVWLRVDQYGLTPDRLAALISASVVLIYAAAYAASLLRRGDWRRAQRSVNRWMALVTLAIAALWLTPLLHAERLATASQIARAEQGRTAALWEMAHDWGIAGRRGLARLEARAQAGADDDLLAAIALARQAPNRWDFYKDRRDDGVATLDGIVPLRPDGVTLPKGALDGLDPGEREMIHQACARRLTGGHPGCVIVVAPFEPSENTDRAIGLFATDDVGAHLASYRMSEGRLIRQGFPIDILAGSYPYVSNDVIVDVLTGQYRLAPVPRTVLEVGGLQLFPQY